MLLRSKSCCGCWKGKLTFGSAQRTGALPRIAQQLVHHPNFCKHLPMCRALYQELWRPQGRCASMLRKERRNLCENPETFMMGCAQVQGSASPFTHRLYPHPQQLGWDPACHRDVANACPSNEGMRVRPHWPENSPEETSLGAQIELSGGSDTAHEWYPTIPEAAVRASLFLRPEA